MRNLDNWTVRHRVMSILRKTQEKLYYLETVLEEDRLCDACDLMWGIGDLGEQLRKIVGKEAEEYFHPNGEWKALSWPTKGSK